MKKGMLFLAFAALLVCSRSSVAQAPSPAASASAEETGCPPPGARPFRPGMVPNQGGLAGTAARRPGPPERQFKKRLLIWADTRNGIAQHDIAHAEAVIEEMGYRSGLYDSYIRTDSNIISRHPKMTTGQPASGGPSLCNVDAIFFLGHREIDLDAQGRADLLWFVHDAGKGFVAAHTAVTAFGSWPEFGDLLGASFDEHPWGQTTAPLIVDDPRFPGMEFKSGDKFHDEFYQLSNFKADRIHVVLSLDTSGLEKTSRVHPGDSYALAYAKMYGKGRVFYSSLGHAPATWDDPRVRAMYFGAIEWALGLADADIAPNPDAVKSSDAGSRQGDRPTAGNQ